MEVERPTHKQIAPNLYVGSVKAAEDAKFLSAAKIVTIANASSESIPAIYGITIRECPVPVSELLDSEIPKNVAKLSAVAEFISESIAKGPVLICCALGVNQCMLVAGCYLVSKKGNPDKVIFDLETLYFSEKQRADYIAYNKITEVIQTKETMDYMTAAEREEYDALCKTRAEREDLRSLTMRSFRKVIKEMATKK